MLSFAEDDVADCCRRPGVVSAKGQQRLLAEAALFVAACLLAVLSGCAHVASPDAARTALEEDLAAVSQGDYAAVDAYIAATYFDSNDYGVTAAAFDKAYFADFSYEVSDAQANGGSAATASLSVTVPNSGKVLKTLEQARTKATAAGKKTTGQGAADKIFAKLAKKAAWGSDTLHMDVAMTCDDDGNWTVDDPVTLGVVLLDGYDYRQVAE